MNKKSIIFATVSVLLIILVIIILINVNKKVEVSDVTIDNNQATGEVYIEEIKFTDITKVYDSGITTIRAKMLNTTNTTKNVTVKIILKDEQGNELRNMIQVVENLLPNKEKVLSTGIAGDYSKVNEIKFEIIK